MFLRENNVVSFNPTNEAESKFKQMILVRNNWRKWRKFNDIKDNHNGTITLFIEDGFQTEISKNRLPEVIQSGKVNKIQNNGGDYYAVIGCDVGKIPLHRFLKRHELALYEGFQEETGYSIQVHHKDEDTFNNTDDNLEVVTAKENVLLSRLKNSKGYKKRGNRFIVQFQGKHVGSFETKEEAIQVYQKTVTDELNRLEKIRIDFLKKNGLI
ncbi:HNH endonuclease [Piscibacillus sp. B03]|uniref:HNH endonuclease n=1 Tax=Piscibacillus sp. B03 TaxID=3457430 RepID=UPI003FCD5AEA